MEDKNLIKIIVQYIVFKCSINNITKLNLNIFWKEKYESNAINMKLIKKITAPNLNVFTGDGTNTYLVGKEDITLIDPGSNKPAHI